MSDPKADLKAPAPAKPETFAVKADIPLRQRDGSFVWGARAGQTIPMADARRLAKAGALDLDTGKAPEPKAGK